MFEKLIRSVFLLWISCFLMVGVTPCLAQPQQVQEPEEQVFEDVNPETAEFREATDRLRDHLKRMREVFIRYHASQSKPDAQKWQTEWMGMLSEGDRLHLAMIAAAVAEYRKNPAEKDRLGTMLFKTLKRHCDSDQFEGMLPVAQALMEAGYPEVELAGLYAMAALAENEYELAREPLTFLASQQRASPAMLQMLENLDALKAEWEEELRLRTKDAAGEPLPRVLIKTNKGDIEVELFENQAPETVGNFMALVEDHFFDHLQFHRVLEHFMAQGGCPNNDGTGDPGYTIFNEANKPNARKFFRGSLGLALAPDMPDSGGSQFFIAYLPVYNLNGEYTVFGRVLSGMEVVSNLNRINPDEKDEKKEPVLPDEILTIEVLYKRDHEYRPTKVPKDQVSRTSVEDTQP